MKNIDLNSSIIEKIKVEAPELIKEFMKNDLVKMILYGSCARGEFKEHSDVDIALLTKGAGLTLGNITIKLMKWQQNWQ